MHLFLSWHLEHPSCHAVTTFLNAAQPHDTVQSYMHDTVQRYMHDTVQKYMHESWTAMATLQMHLSSPLKPQTPWK